MIFRVLLTLLLASVAQVACAQGGSDYPALQKQADEVAKATVANDFAKVADYTHPKLVQKMGGRERLITRIQQAADEIKGVGVTLIGAEMGKPSQIEKIGSVIFAVLPMKMIMRMPDGKYEGQSSMMAISEDGGQQWKFLDGTIDQAHFEILFPEVKGKVAVPTLDPEPKRIGN
ncbi:MAG TPA: hypothetical protein VGO43_11865 [Pyrinomonadaceae bacterium]|jgi:hypothetical protein|nr:hypothetical protein [Pyrinomonadaceae bacterium]